MKELLSQADDLHEKYLIQENQKIAEHKALVNQVLESYDQKTVAEILRRVGQTGPVKR